MLCWSSRGFWSGQVLGLILDRLGTENQRGPGASLKIQHKVGQRLGPDRTGGKRKEWACASLSAPGLVWESADVGLDRGEEVRDRARSQEMPANGPGLSLKGESPTVSILVSQLLTF